MQARLPVLRLQMRIVCSSGPAAGDSYQVCHLQVSWRISPCASPPLLSFVLWCSFHGDLTFVMLLHGFSTVCCACCYIRCLLCAAAVALVSCWALSCCCACLFLEPCWALSCSAGGVQVLLLLLLQAAHFVCSVRCCYSKDRFTRHFARAFVCLSAMLSCCRAAKLRLQQCIPAACFAPSLS